jgi:hypothetical protein
VKTLIIQGFEPLIVDSKIFKKFTPGVYDIGIPPGWHLPTTPGCTYSILVVYPRRTKQEHKVLGSIDHNPGLSISITQKDILSIDK